MWTKLENQSAFNTVTDKNIVAFFFGHGAINTTVHCI